MLEVRRVDDGLWVGNGNRRVHLSDWKLNTYDYFSAVGDDGTEGELVYTHTIPMIEGESYDSTEIVPETYTIVMRDSTKVAYQYRAHDQCWMCAKTGAAYEQLPPSSYTILYIGD